MSPGEPTAIVKTRIKRTARDRLRRLAAADNRSVASYLAALINRHLNEQRSKP